MLVILKRHKQSTTAHLGRIFLEDLFTQFKILYPAGECQRRGISTLVKFIQLGKGTYVSSFKLFHFFKKNKFESTSSFYFVHL
jgi:hypothetical protein